MKKLKRNFLTISPLIILGGLLLGFGVSNITQKQEVSLPVSADHTHNFVNNHQCDCGAYRLEAEYATISGAGLLLRKESSAVTSHVTSQYNCVGDFDASGDYVLWTFTLDKAVSGIKGTLWGANCSGNSAASNILYMQLNGITINTLSSVTPIDYTNWYRWEAIDFNNLSFNAGTNTIKIINKGAACNIDCIDLEMPKANQVHVNHMARLESENSRIVGTPSGSSTKVTTRAPAYATEFLSTSSLDSGGYSVGNWQKGDTNTHFNFSISKSCKVRLAVGLAFINANSYTIPNRLYGIGIDGYTHTTGDNFINNSDLTISTTSYHGWASYIYTTDLDVTAGAHYVHLEASDGSSVNIDYVDIIAVDTSAIISAWDDTESNILIEAEHGIASGTPSSGNVTFHVNNDTCSNFACVGNWDSGASITWTVNATSASSYTTATFYMCTWSGSGSPNTYFSLSVNGNTVTFDNFQRIGGTVYYGFITERTNTFSLKAGENTITLSAKSFLGLNMDKLTLTSDTALNEVYKGSSYTKINSTNELYEGAKVVIGTNAKLATKYNNVDDLSYLLGQNTDLDNSGRVKAYDAGVFTVSRVSDGWRLVSDEGYYLYKNNTALKGTTSPSGTAVWSISISSGVATISNGGYNFYYSTTNRPSGDISLSQNAANVSLYVLTVGTDAQFVTTFINGYMHLTDYTEQLGYCSDNEHHYYSTAKSAFNALTSSQRALFNGDSAYSSACARLQAWAAANGDSMNSTTHILNSSNYRTTPFDGPDSILMIIISVVTTGICISFLVIKSVKKNKEK